MANRRMISKAIYETDNFSEMPNSAQSLYTHYILQADDDGFVGNPKILLRMYGANDDDLKLLIAKGFLIPFEDGVIAITHWKMMNNIRKERYTPTNYKDDYQKLELTDQKSYKLLAPIKRPSLEDTLPQNDQKTTPCQTSGMTTSQTSGVTSGVQSVIPSVGKYSKGKVRSDKERDIHTSSNIQSETKNKYEEIIEYLNKKFSMRLNPNLSNTNKAIDQMTEQGYSVDDFKILIDKLDSSNAISWNNEEEKKEALRPKTLFTKENFDKYLNETKLKDHFNTNNGGIKFTHNDKVKGIISYINKVFNKEIDDDDSIKLHDDEQTDKTINLALSLFKNDDKKLLDYIKENRDDYSTTTELLTKLEQES